jgi:hypothetical protein
MGSNWNLLYSETQRSSRVIISWVLPSLKSSIDAQSNQACNLALLLSIDWQRIGTYQAACVSG